MVNPQKMDKYHIIHYVHDAKYHPFFPLQLISTLKTTEFTSCVCQLYNTATNFIILYIHMVALINLVFQRFWALLEYQTVLT